jgi:tyrosyl-tRNA synthetase
VMENARTFQQQAYKILDPQRTRTVFNGEWFEIMTFEQVMKLNARVTLQQMMQREDFRTRYEQQEAVRLHELQYPIMQGWDSVMVRADVELGGNDQLFNILVGRDLQREEGQPEQVVFLLPLLEGLDGVQKMSKSFGNYVGVNEPPIQMFGKLMSISDELMVKYYRLLLAEEVAERLLTSDESARTIIDGIHPMVAKKDLARRVVERYHGPEAAQHALDDFNTRFSKKDLASADLPILDAGSYTILSLVLEAYRRCYQLSRSGSEVRRLITQGSVHINGEKFTDPNREYPFEPGDIVRLDKTRAVRIA